MGVSAGDDSWELELEGPAFLAPGSIALVGTASESGFGPIVPRLSAKGCAGGRGGTVACGRGSGQEGEKLECARWRGSPPYGSNADPDFSPSDPYGCVLGMGSCAALALCREGWVDRARTRT